VSMACSLGATVKVAWVCSPGVMAKAAWARAARQRWLMWCVDSVLAGSDSESGMGVLTRSDGKSSMGEGGKTKVVDMVWQWHARWEQWQWHGCAHQE
jgi:hypothetical protein